MIGYNAQCCKKRDIFDAFQSATVDTSQYYLYLESGRVTFEQFQYRLGTKVPLLFATLVCNFKQTKTGVHDTLELQEISVHCPDSQLIRSFQIRLFTEFLLMLATLAPCQTKGTLTLCSSVLPAFPDRGLHCQSSSDGSHVSVFVWPQCV